LLGNVFSTNYHSDFFKLYSLTIADQCRSKDRGSVGRRAKAH